MEKQIKFNKLEKFYHFEKLYYERTLKNISTY